MTFEPFAHPFEPNFLDLCRMAQVEVLPCFQHFSAVSEHNTRKVLDAFRQHRLSDAHFAGTTGYGYDDNGRDTLDRVMADVMDAEDAMARVQFVSGTHTIACCLFGLLAPGDTLVSVMGPPYDTLLGVIGVPDRRNHSKKPTTDAKPGSLRHWGVSYREVPVTPDGRPDDEAIAAAVSAPEVKVALLQRSRGYNDRVTLSIADMERLIPLIRKANPNIVIFVDNCYGEFVETREPCAVGADLIAGSLIKNPGGGLAPTGGYVAGRRALVEQVAARLTAPGLGRHVGTSLGQNRLLYQGLFLAPHTVSQALMTAAFCASLMQRLHYAVDPLPEDARSDIIQRIRFGADEPLLAFCRGLQSASPVDSHVTPEPWAMPGYEDEVVMAAGAFIQGSSIELSCDAPMREPFDLFFQGGLTYEAGKLAVMTAAYAALQATGRDGV